ncbi:MAG: efflux RND transporter permease subunit, partial [Blastocatellia bacterium]
MNWLVSKSLHLRYVVVALAIVLLIVGIRVVRTAPLDVFPEFAPPLVEIQTEAPGLSTAEVESLITAPIENALNGAADLMTLRSKSVLGLSSVVLIFKVGADLMQARQLVQERLALVAPRLPSAARAPVILQPLSSTSRALKIGITSKTLSQMEMTTLARWTIRPRLMSVPGVANVAIWGERDRQMQVRVDPERLRAHNLTIDDVVKATTAAVAVGAGGFVDTPNQRLPVLHIQHRGATTQPADLAGIPVAFRKGAPLPLGAVAEVAEGFPPPIGDAVINDGPGLLLIVEKQPTGNTLDVTRNVEAAIDALRPGLRELEIDSTIFRPATFIETALANLRNAMLIGCLLVVAVLALFLFEWRTAVISLSAIPLSLLAAAMVLYYFGYTINTMVIAGLVIALGEVVDDAIIDVENIIRRLRLNRQKDAPEPALKVVLNASVEVRSAIVYATLIVVLVFLPIFFLDGLAGSFFRPLAIAYVLAVLASLGVALTLTPALSLLLLPRGVRAEHRDPPLTRVLKRAYRAILPGFLARPMAAGLGVVVIFGLTAAAVPFLGEEFLPNFKERDFLMHWVGKPGASLEAMTRIT